MIAAAPTANDGIALNPAASYAPFADPPRPLTVLEQTLMRAPGRYGGAAFDLDAAVAEAKSLNPQTADQWREAIIAITQGDYAADAQAVISFKASISGNPAPPVRHHGVTVVGQNHYAIVLDASGSMADKSGGRSRMDQAKAAIASFAKGLPATSTVSLRIYGYVGTGTTADKAASCASSKVVYAGKPSGVEPALAGVQPAGWTPLARGIEQVASDVPRGTSDAIVYVVTDGIETCGGDPVAAARKVGRLGVKPVINVVGFQVGNKDAAQLRQIARAGHGRYFGADSGTALTQYWREDTQAMMRAWEQWKRHALANIERQGAANLKRAEVPGQRLLDGIETEWRNQTAMVDALKQDGSLTGVTASDVWTQLYARHSAIWTWAYANKSENWTQAYIQKSTRWQAAYTLGSGKWSHYYAQSRGH